MSVGVDVGLNTGVNVLTRAIRAQDATVEVILKDFTFENGVLGAMATEFMDAQGLTIYQNTHVHSGSMAAQCTMTAGSTGFGNWGGIVYWDTPHSEGDEVYVKVNTYFPSAFDNTTNFALKFLRLRVADSLNGHKGYVDVYIRDSLSDTYMVQNEVSTTTRFSIDTAETGSVIQGGPFILGETLTGETNGGTAVIRTFRADNNDPVLDNALTTGVFTRYEWIVGSQSGARVELRAPGTIPYGNGSHGLSYGIVRDVWETLYYHVKFSATNPIIELFKVINGVPTLIYRDTTDYTLPLATDINTQFNLFTYWNGEPALPTADQTMYIDDFKITTTKPSELP